MEPGPIWQPLLLQVLLILCNAIFAATEIAVISLNDNKLRRQAEGGDVKAKRLLRITEKPESFLSTIQIGITLAGFLGSAFAADNFASRIVTWLVDVRHVTAVPAATLNTLCVVGITIILSYFSLVFGELVPKRVAMQHSEKVARLASGLIAGIQVVMRPVIRLLSASTNGVLRLMRINPNAQQEQVTEEEIRMMVDIGEEKGAIETNEREMIENVFEFNNTNAADVMTHRTDITGIWIHETPDTIVQTIRDTGYSRFPVYDEDIDDIIGILTTRTYLLNERRAQPLPLRELVRDAYFVPETVKTNVLFRDMQTKKVHIAIVVDEYGGTSGMVTMEDLLEEIVGNIYDEFDPQDEQDIEQLGPNLWRVSGGVDLETLADTLQVDLPLDEEYDTLGGLVFSQLSVIPQDGSTPEVDANGLRIRVETMEDRRVEQALVSKLLDDEALEPETLPEAAHS